MKDKTKEILKKEIDSKRDRGIHYNLKDMRNRVAEIVVQLDKVEEANKDKNDDKALGSIKYELEWLSNSVMRLQQKLEEVRMNVAEVCTLVKVLYVDEEVENGKL
jgi:hypothetical protein